MSKNLAANRKREAEKLAQDRRRSLRSFTRQTRATQARAQVAPQVSAPVPPQAPPLSVTQGPVRSIPGTRARRAADIFKRSAKHLAAAKKRKEKADERQRSLRSFDQLLRPEVSSRLLTTRSLNQRTFRHRVPPSQRLGVIEDNVELIREQLTTVLFNNPIYIADKKKSDKIKNRQKREDKAQFRKKVKRSRDIAKETIRKIRDRARKSKLGLTGTNEQKRQKTRKINAKMAKEIAKRRTKLATRVEVLTEKSTEAIRKIDASKPEGLHKILIQARDSRSDRNISSGYRQFDDIIDFIIDSHIRRLAAEYDEDEFTIDTIIIQSLDFRRDVMKGMYRSIEVANKKWFMVNPQSKHNCVFHSIAVCHNYKRNPNLLRKDEKEDEGKDRLGQLARTISSRNLKAMVKPTSKNFSDFKTIQEICDYVKHPIILYNNIFEKIKEFSPACRQAVKKAGSRQGRKAKPYEIQKVGTHCKALILKKDLREWDPDFIFPEVSKKDEETNDEDELIRKTKKFGKYKTKLATWDIETSPNSEGAHTPYACSIAWYEYGDATVEKEKWVRKKVKSVHDGDEIVGEEWVKQKYKVQDTSARTAHHKQWWGLDCLQEMVHWLAENPKFSGYTFYAHNGGKYDLPLAIEKAFLESDEFFMQGEKCIELNNAWIGFSLQHCLQNDYEISFRDSCRMLPMSLEKLCLELDVEHKKLTETICHADITLENYNTFPQLKTYLKHDVLGLLEVMTKFGEEIFNDSGIDITQCFTGAGLSKSNFFKNFYKGNVCTLSDAHDEFVRQSYFGGRVECFTLGPIQDIYYYDFTSLYPAAGLKNLPVGTPEEVELFGPELPPKWFGWVECLVKTKDRNALPKHSIIHNKRLVFPIFDEWTKIFIFSDEVDHDIYEYQFLKGLKFDKDRFMKKFFQQGFEKKAHAKANNNPALAQAQKIIINSGYGFWGLRTKDRDGVIICEPGNEDYLEFLDTDRLISIREVNGYVICRVRKNLNVKTFNVSVAAAISSYARSMLHKLITAIRAMGGVVHYCDTDSIITNINLKEYPDLQRKFQWDGDGSQLGSLKNECDEYVQKILMNKSLVKIMAENRVDKNKAKHAYTDSRFFHQDKVKLQNLRDLEGGNLRFDGGVITGLKQYALRKTILIDGQEEKIEIVKLKGYSQKYGKLTYEHMEQMDRGEKITQIQKQFRCPKSNYVSETSSFQIKTVDVQKSFRKCYSKGIVNGSNVTPLIL